MKVGRTSSFRDAHLAAIVDHSSDAIVSKDLDGNVLSWNVAAERLFGIPASEMIGQSIRRIIPADRQDEEDRILARVRSGELVPKFETMRLRADGAEIPVAITVSPIRDELGHIIGASKIANDLREQASLRTELLRSQRQFKALANNIPQLAWMATSDARVFWYNQRWYDFTGTTPENTQGWGWHEILHPDHAQRVIDSIGDTWSKGEPWEGTYPLRGADGEYRWFLSRAQPVHDEKGDLLFWCGTNTDITEERETNERIRLLMNEVNHRARNILATIQAIVHRTVGEADPALTEALVRRITALAANQDLLTKSNWSGATVDAICRSQMLHVVDPSDGRVEFDGPEGLMLKPTAAEALGLAIHELATNAMKYGALSSETGKVSLRWDIVETEGKQRLDIEWRESGGPPVSRPDHKGFGTAIITRNPEMALRGKVTLDYAPEGVVWRVTTTDKVFSDGASAGSQTEGQRAAATG
ncbi:PAS domain S-box protein [Pelagerythrobacter aerophilus]